MDPDDDDDLPWGHEGYEVRVCVCMFCATQANNRSCQRM